MARELAEPLRTVIVFAPGGAGPAPTIREKVNSAGSLVAGYRFRSLFGGVGRRGAVAIRMAVAISVGWGNANGLAGVREIGWDGFGYVGY
jgi:hypothetical protein